MTAENRSLGQLGSDHCVSRARVEGNRNREGTVVLQKSRVPLLPGPAAIHMTAYGSLDLEMQYGLE